MIILLILIFDGENFLPEYEDMCDTDSCFDYKIITDYALTGDTWEGYMKDNIV